MKRADWPKNGKKKKISVYSQSATSARLHSSRDEPPTRGHLYECEPLSLSGLGGLCVPVPQPAHILAQATPGAGFLRYPPVH